MLVITLMDNGSILLNSPSIQTMFNNQDEYLQVKVEGTINCCPQLYSHTALMPLVDSDYLAFSSAGIEVKPKFFDVITPNKIIDGVYHFNVKIFSTEDQYHYEEDCAFMDITFKCKVAAYIDQLNSIFEEGQIATNVHILHYALTNGSNCGCNCQALCDTFKQLYDLLKPTSPQIQGCGC